MYKSTYLTVRVHGAEEAAVIVPEETVDHLLWLIDVYDVKTGCAPAVKKLLMSTYHKEQERVPGILPRWTKTMLTWVTFLHALPEQQHADTTAFPACRRGVWEPSDVMIALDALAMHWNPDVSEDYLNTIWSKCKELVMHRHAAPSEVFEKVDDMYAVKPECIMAMLSRFYWFNQTLDQLKWFPAARAPQIVHYFDQFIGNEKRHLKVAKFREGLTKLVWDRELFYGDREIAGHDQIGVKMSSYSCLYKRRPVCLMQKYQNILSYGTYEEICERFQDVLWLYMIRSHFINNYQIDFIKYFVCWEVDQHKHRSALNSMSTPVILERFGKYTVLHGGKTYLNGSIRDAFPLWAHFADKPHGRQLHLKTLWEPSTYEL